MSAWQRLNAPRNKREKRVAKIARDIERERIIAVLEKMSDTASFTKTKVGTQTVWVIENAIVLIKGENK